jgi:hypothetical protein
MVSISKGAQVIVEADHHAARELPAVASLAASPAGWAGDPKAPSAYIGGRCSFVLTQIKVLTGPGGKMGPDPA